MPRISAARYAEKLQTAAQIILSNTNATVEEVNNLVGEKYQGERMGIVALAALHQALHQTPTPASVTIGNTVIHLSAPTHLIALGIAEAPIINPVVTAIAPKVKTHSGPSTMAPPTDDLDILTRPSQYAVRPPREPGQVRKLTAVIINPDGTETIVPLDKVSM